MGPNVHQLMFGSKPDSPFKDVRVRRAASMSIDRDFYAEVDTNKLRRQINSRPRPKQRVKTNV